jgi:hypothetical protein
MGLLGLMPGHWNILTPLVLARKALRLMNIDHLAALGTGPLFFFVLNELSYADLLYACEIVNHAHAILASITLIQVIQPVARKAATTEAVPGSTLRHLLAVLDSAHDAGFWFDAVVAPATGAGLMISRICNTETTVHSTGSDQRRGNGICFYRLFPCHTGIP